MLHELCLLFSEPDADRERALRERLFEFGEDSVLGLGLLLTCPDVAPDTVAAGTHLLRVCEHKLDLNNLNIARRADVALHMGDVRVVKEADDLEDRVYLANVREELVTQARTFRSALHKSGDIDKLYSGGQDLLTLRESRELVEPRVRYANDTDRGVDGTEGVVLRRDALLRERVKQRRLPHIWQSDYSDL